MRASFGHIVGGMAGGYYSDLWAQSLALEMLSSFTPNVLDPKVCARLRSQLLSQGGQKEEMDLVRDFLAGKQDPPGAGLRMRPHVPPSP